MQLAEVEDRTDVQRVSSFVDDVFYVAGRLLMRSLAGNDVHSVCATVNNIANVLATEVLATMATHVQNAQPAFATWFETSRRQDAAPEKPLNGSRACDSLPHALNNICYSKVRLGMFAVYPFSRHACRSYHAEFRQTSMRANC